MNSSSSTPMMDALGVDPKMLELPHLLSEGALVAAIHEAIPNLPPRVDDFPRTPDLVPDNGSSLSSPSSPYSPVSPSPTYGYLSLPQLGSIDYDAYSPPAPISELSSSPTLPATLVLAEAPCAGGKPVKQKDGGYRCPACRKIFKRRDDAKRHIDSAGKRLKCKYCSKPSSGRRDGLTRHLKAKNCLALWKIGYEAGRFTTRTVDDAFY